MRSAGPRAAADARLSSSSRSESARVRCRAIAGWCAAETMDEGCRTAYPRQEIGPRRCRSCARSAPWPRGRARQRDRRARRTTKETPSHSRRARSRRGQSERPRTCERVLKNVVVAAPAGTPRGGARRGGQTAGAKARASVRDEASGRSPDTSQADRPRWRSRRDRRARGEHYAARWRSRRVPRDRRSAAAIHGRAAVVPSRSINIDRRAGGFSQPRPPVGPASGVPICRDGSERAISKGVSGPDRQDRRKWSGDLRNLTGGHAAIEASAAAGGARMPLAELLQASPCAKCAATGTRHPGVTPDSCW